MAAVDLVPSTVAEIQEEEDFHTPFLGVNIKNSAHFVKLRHDFSVNDRLRAEVGWDHAAKGTNASRPWGALLFQLDANNKDEGAIEINNDFITVNKQFEIKVPLKTNSIGVGAKLGVTTKGTPHVQLSIDSVPIMLAAAALMLVLKKPVSISRKETGGLSFNLPLGGSGRPSYTLQERAEVDGSLRRKGRGLVLDVQELNGVIRLRQEEKVQA